VLDVLKIPELSFQGKEWLVAEIVVPGGHDVIKRESVTRICNISAFQVNFKEMKEKKSKNQTF